MVMMPQLPASPVLFSVAAAQAFEFVVQKMQCVAMHPASSFEHQWLQPPSVLPSLESACAPPAIRGRSAHVCCTSSSNQKEEEKIKCVEGFLVEKILCPVSNAHLDGPKILLSTVKEFLQVVHFQLVHRILLRVY